MERIEDDTFCPAALRKDALVALQKARGINTLIGLHRQSSIAKLFATEVPIHVLAMNTDDAIGTFFDNLAASVGRDGRVHASLNLNTTTGRLSCKAPNLQNQPALEKDKCVPYIFRFACIHL